MDIEHHLRFSTEYWRRFWYFRQIEGETIEGETKPIDSCAKSFALLSEMEKCYSAKAYRACLLLSLAAIEAAIRYELKASKKVPLAKLLEQSGYADDVKWLRDFRNEFIHSPDCSMFNDLADNVKDEELEGNCIRAFKLAHIVYCYPIKQSKTNK